MLYYSFCWFQKWFNSTGVKTLCTFELHGNLEEIFGLPDNCSIHFCCAIGLEVQIEGLAKLVID